MEISRWVAHVCLILFEFRLTAQASVGNDTAEICSPNSAIEYDEQIDTPLEFQKPLGTGTNIWPSTPATYAWSLACTKLDALQNWWTTPSNRDAFAHVTHTFSHAGLNNATYSDVSKEVMNSMDFTRIIMMLSISLDFFQPSMARPGGHRPSTPLLFNWTYSTVRIIPNRPLQA